MFSRPMFRWEYLAASRKRRPFVVRTFVAVVLGLAMVGVGLVVFATGSSTGLALNRTRLATFGRVMFLVACCVELVLLAFFVPNFVGGSIAEEREKDTLPLLLLTRLTPFEIVATKALGRWLSVLNLVLIGFPVILVSAWLSGLERELAPALVGLVSSSAFMSTLAILASANRDQVGTARAQATAWIFGWLILPPALSVIPSRTGSLWGDLLTELKSLCELVAPSSPLSLLSDRAWFYRPEVVSLEGRVAWMVGLQALLGLLALGLAASALKARERNPNWLDPTRGYRPPCGDDPIYWREYDLPMRRGGGSIIAIRLRYVWILIRATLMNLMQLLVVILALATPIGLLFATLHYGFAAFQELWRHGYGGVGPFDDRIRFNGLIRMVTGFLAFISIGIASSVSSRITTERDKKTWETFLTTPLSGQEIFHSKARATRAGIWQASWPLLVIWGLGIVCGVLTPWGVVLAAVDLTVALWAALALGFMLGVRPGTTSSASSWAATSMLVFFAIHAPVLFAALASPREFAMFASWSPGLRWGLVLTVLGVPTLTAGVAWSLTRRSVDRFDEWVGRPFQAKR